MVILLFIWKALITVVAAFICIWVYFVGDSAIGHAHPYEKTQKFIGYTMKILAFPLFLLLSHWAHM